MQTAVANVWATTKYVCTKNKFSTATTTINCAGFFVAHIKLVYIAFFFLYIEGRFHVMSYQADFASQCTFDHHVGFLFIWCGIGKHKKMSRNF